MLELVRVRDVRAVTGVAFDPFVLRTQNCLPMGHCRTQCLVDGLRCAGVALDVRIEHHGAVFQGEMVNLRLTVGLVNAYGVTGALCTIVLPSNRAREIILVAHLWSHACISVLLHTVAFGSGSPYATQ